MNNTPSRKPKKAYEEALAICRQLAEREPHIYQPYAATTLNNLGNVLDEQHAFPEAQKAYEEAVAAAETATGETGASKEATRSLSLAKRYAENAYCHLAVASAMANNEGKVFRYLAALREGNYRATSPGTAGDLDDARAALGRLAKRISRKVTVLIVQAAADHTLFAALDCERLRWELQQHENGVQWPEGLANLVKEYDKWLKGVAHLISLTQDKREAKKKKLQGEEKRLDTEITRTLDNMVMVSRQIQAAAQLAFNSLPGFVQALLSSMAECDVLLSPAGKYDFFPFEVLRYGNGPADYVGYRHALPRVGGISARALDVLGLDDASERQMRAFVTADPKGDLSGAREEGEDVAKSLSMLGYEIFPKGKALVGNEVTVEAFLEGLKSGALIIHYAGHGIIPPPESPPPFARHELNEELLELHDAPLGPSTLREKDIQLDSGPLVFLNSCLTGQKRISGGVREDLCGSLLDRGARVVVASAFPIFEHIGGIFSRRFYATRFKDPVGSVFCTARSFVEILCRRKDNSRKWKAMWPSWALLWYYGDPYLRLPGGVCNPKLPVEEKLDRVLHQCGLRLADANDWEKLK